ncbi:class I SAM-dependent methyltransferase [Planktothrix agardhii 1029]|jgi:hypothetical protein|uniref:class I SAM-dependent methyltransferase n=1 Tax=Planktothrix agardhii TaxID=1160 RepID=UPI000DBB7F2B|nr:class I SAM-dependent methyltransferase [Planktothrix agardhii]MCF3591665.1 class I SAM-dependent methyltransferase [Planktothrix agardhii 1029]MCF3618869.1 class I SAM-dependent methyltransferase [Planktothrix agardhii 1030]BBD54342.1 unknown protein [Planktothrix agardhii NIES-204]
MRLSHRDFYNIVKDIHFRFVQPHENVPKGIASQTMDCFGMAVPINHFNIHFGDQDQEIRSILNPLLNVQGMSTIAIAYIIYELTKFLDPEEVYLNIGVWKGYSFLAGVLNKDAMSIGVDNFSKFGGPRDEFMQNYEPLRHEKSSFFDMSYETYLETIHQSKIGLYFYDGAHDYNSQLEALTRAEPFFSNNTVIIVDDSNFQPARNATLEFIRGKDKQYEILMDQFTSVNGHPTYHNGLMILLKYH